jgi:hypothetical protein
MNIGHHGNASVTADRPELRERVAVEDAHAGFIGVGVKIVVINDVPDLATIPPYNAKQKGAGFMATFAASIQFAQGLSPSLRRAAQPVLTDQQRPNNRPDERDHRLAPDNR